MLQLLASLGDAFFRPFDFLSRVLAGLISFIATLILVSILGGLLYFAALAADNYILHWHWPALEWLKLSMGIVYAWALLVSLAPFVLEFFTRLISAAVIIALIAGLVTFLTDIPWRTTATNIAVWTCPVIFVFWFIGLLRGKDL